MKNRNAASLFFTMFLRATVIILGVVIFLFGAFFLFKVITGKKPARTPATTAGEIILTEAEAPDHLLTAAPTVEPLTTEADAPTETTELPDVKNASILVLNSTEITGLAGRWCKTLNADGYANTTAADFRYNQETTHIYVKTDGIGNDLVKYFASADCQEGDAPEGASIGTPGFDIVIIIGNSDDDH